MKNCPLSSKKKCTLIVLALLFVFCALLSTPSAVFAILDRAERHLGRALRDPGRWIEIVKHCSYIAMTVIALAAFLGCTERGKKLANEVQQELCAWSKKIGAKRFAIAVAGVGLFYYK